LTDRSIRTTSTGLAEATTSILTALHDRASAYRDSRHPPEPPDSNPGSESPVLELDDLEVEFERR
jgi:hypothetical protein